MVGTSAMALCRYLSCSRVPCSRSCFRCRCKRIVYKAIFQPMPLGDFPWRYDCTAARTAASSKNLMYRFRVRKNSDK